MLYYFIHDDRHPYFWADEKKLRFVLIAGSDVLRDMKHGFVNLAQYWYPTIFNGWTNIFTDSDICQWKKNYISRSSLLVIFKRRPKGSTSTEVWYFKDYYPDIQRWKTIKRWKTIIHLAPTGSSNIHSLDYIMSFSILLFVCIANNLMEQVLVFPFSNTSAFFKKQISQLIVDAINSKSI